MGFRLVITISMAYKQRNKCSVVRNPVVKDRVTFLTEYLYIVLNHGKYFWLIQVLTNKDTKLNLKTCMHLESKDEIIIS